MKIQGITITEENYISIQGDAGNYEIIVWEDESESEGDDGGNAISRTQLPTLSDAIIDRANIDNSH